MRSISAKEWYNIFLKHFMRKEILKIFMNTWNNTKFTNFILNELEKICEEQEYDHKRELLKIDLVWKDGKNDVVAIEHETYGDKNKFNNLINGEIDKLLHRTDAPLRVCITYVRDSRLSELSTKLKDKILDNIKQCNKKDFEFLLLVGPYNIIHPGQYVAYRFYKEFNTELIIPNYLTNAKENKIKVE